VLDELQRLTDVLKLDTETEASSSEDTSYHATFSTLFSHVGKKKIKHCKQHSALLHSLELFTSQFDYTQRPVFVELGCGSAELSKHIGIVSEGLARHILIDRLTFRSCNK
jgi:hypothetical protein